MAISLLLTAFAANAQSVWNKTYIEDRPVMLFGSVLFKDTGYIVTGVTDGVTIGLAKAMLGEINMNGDLVNYKIVVDSNPDYYGLFTNALIKTQDEKIAFSGLSFDSLGYLFFGTADLDLNSVSTFKYHSPNTSTQIGYSLLEDEGNYFIVGIKLDSIAYNADVFLTKIDSAGGKVWEKQYHRYSRDEAASIIKLANGNLMIGATRIDLYQDPQRANTWLLEVDTGGGIVRQWFDPNDSTYAAEGLKQTSDGGFIYGAQKKYEQPINDIYYTATIVKMNNSFQKQWTFKGGIMGNYTGFRDIEMLPDGNYIACGNFSNREAWVVKLNSGGNLIWEKKFEGLTDTFPTWNFLTDIDVLPDGGLIAVGECRRLINPNQLPPQVGWFLKLDSNGCEMESCLVGIDPQAPKGGFNSPIQLQPNPANDYVEIILPDELQNGAVKIFDIAGRAVKLFQVSGFRVQVDVSDLSKGMYVVAVEKDGRRTRTRLIME